MSGNVEGWVPEFVELVGLFYLCVLHVYTKLAFLCVMMMFVQDFMVICQYLFQAILRGSKYVKTSHSAQQPKQKHLSC